MERKIENKSCCTILVDPINDFELNPNPQNSQCCPQKQKKTLLGQN